MRFRHHRPRLTIALIAAGAAGLALAAPGTATAASRPDRVGVPNAQPRLTRSASSGRSSRGESIEVKLYLAGRDPAGLDAAVQAVSTPGSSQYGNYLSAAQFRARYSPADAGVSAVEAFLTSHHLTIGASPDNHLYVAARGTVAQVETAFATSLENYDLDGHTIRAASTAPTIPAELDGLVTAVSGLASVSSLMTYDHDGGRSDVAGSSSSARLAAAPAAKAAGTQAPPPDAFVNATPCSAYYGEKIATTAPPAYGSKQPYAPCGYVPRQLQGAYGLAKTIAKGQDGSGVTVAITDAYAAPTIVKDAKTYANRHGQAALGGQFRQLKPADTYRYGYDDAAVGDICGEQGWYGEETLDVEAVHAVAPGANITYVPSRSCDNGDFADTLNRVVDKQLADIVTNSWGGVDESNGSPELDAAYHAVFSQAALEGIGMYFSSGDNGDGSSVNPAGAIPTTQSPANDPLVTAVGGTSIAIGKNNRRIAETGWSTARSALTDGAWTPAPPGAYQYGGGGGTSRVFTQPRYQKGVVPGALSKRYASTPARVVPDVSAIGDPNTGMLVGETQTFPDGTAKYSEYRIGGTSLASPVFAGIMSISDQIARHPHGFANPALYRAYGTQAFYDPKPVPDTGVVRVDYVNAVDDTEGLITSLRSIDVTNGTILRTATGYDDITGIGSPEGQSFFKALK